MKTINPEFEKERPVVKKTEIDYAIKPKNMNYTDKQLKAALAKLLPKKTYFGINTGDLIWSTGEPVRETELLHLCRLVELKLTSKEYGVYSAEPYKLYSGIDANTIIYLWFTMPWRERVVALAKVKGIEI